MTLSNTLAFSNALPRLRGVVAPVRTLTFRRVDGTKLTRIKPRRAKTKRTASGDANVALIMAVMMSLVFGPVIGVHLIAAFGPTAAGSGEMARGNAPVTPPG